jgi:CheY-like chemotaxis protein
MAQLLELEGYEVITARNGLEGLAKLRESTPPCLVLLDLMMPVMDGWEFQRRLATETAFRSVPIVVVSALDQAGAGETHADAYLRKPVDIDALHSAVQAWCCEGPSRVDALRKGR